MDTAISETWHRQTRRVRYGLIGPVVVLAIWQATHSLALLEPTLLPAPSATGAALVRLFSAGHVLVDLGATLGRMFAGYVMAALVGVTAGLLMGASIRVYDASVTVVDFFRSIPVTSLYPVFVLILGVADASKVGMVFFSSAFIVALQSAYGVSRANHVRREMARLYGASKLQRFRWVIVPEALPQIMIGLRVALSYALIVEIVCEMFMGSRTGLGQRLTDAFTIYAIPEMYALILVCGLLGFVLNRLFGLVESRVVPWAAK